MTTLTCGREPDITVGISTDSGFKIEHTPDGPVARGVRIGIGFHWERRRDFLLDGKIDTRGGSGLFVTLPIERYLESVISSEMNPSAPAEFLKAHAVISRSWALGKILHTHQAGDSGKIDRHDHIECWTDSEAHSGFDVCADDHCQRFQGFASVNSEATNAVRATRGLVLLNADGSLTDARFSKCCGGRTELFSTCWQNVDYPELPSVADPYCDLSDLSPEKRNRLLQSILTDYDAETPDFYSWTRTVSPRLIEARVLELFGRRLGSVTDIKVLRRGPSGRASLLRITGTDATLDLGKELAIRRVLATDCLYSSAFEITRDPEGPFILHGRGWGHGVGLCQTGAARMAADGHTFTSILNHYYPGASLKAIY